MRIQIMDTRQKKQSSVAGYNLTGRSGPSGQTKAIDFHNDNYMMVLVNYPSTGSNYSSSSSVIKVFDRRNKKEKINKEAVFTKQIRWQPTDARFSPDGKYIFGLVTEKGSPHRN